MNILMLSPGFPAEMVHFTRGLSRVGANVIGMGEQPAAGLSPQVREALTHYVQVRSLWDEPEMIREARAVASRVGIDRVECLWEPAMLLAAQIREALGVPGMNVQQTVPFRDKEVMKQVLDRAGIRTPRHVRATNESEVRAGAERIGYPLIVKPIAGAGSADTYRVDDKAGLESTLPKVRHVRELSVEEFIEGGEEYTFDTICTGGKIAYYNIAWYRPRPLIARTVEWLSPQTVTLRNPNVPHLAPGREMGQKVLKALGFQTGFTHMEWFLKPDGEAVFGEIAARPPGARSVDLMNYACDLDTYTGWAEAVCHGQLSQPITRLYNSAIIFKRAKGQGRIKSVEGLEHLVARYRRNVVCIDLASPGEPRRNWKQTLISDGFVIVRHPDLETTLSIADRFGTDLSLYAE